LPSWLEAAKGKKTNRLLNDQTFTSCTCCFRELHVLRTEVSLAMHRLRDELWESFCLRGLWRNIGTFWKVLDFDSMLYLYLAFMIMMIHHVN
jgi:hypothetical protein